jgi:hypothetical protein
MAQQNKNNFEGTFNSPTTGLFKDNTAGDIGADDARTLVDNTADSVPFTLDDSYTWASPKVETSGTNTYTGTLSPAITAYGNGMKVHVKIKDASTGASTLNLNAVGAKKIFINPTTQAGNGDLTDEQDYWMTYDSALDTAAGGWLIMGFGNGIGVTDGDKGDVVVSGSGTVWTVESASETQAGKAEIATQAETNTGTDDARIVTPLKLHTKVVGVQDLFIPASAMWPRVTNGCSSLTQAEVAISLFNIQSLDFDQTTQEFAQCQVRLPRKWNNGTITAAVYWTATSGSGTVQWGISGGAYSNDEALTVALGTAQTSDDTLLATNDLHISPTTSAITLAGSPADADFLAIQISRNPASDTLNADAKLLGVALFLTTDAAIDA